MIREVPKKIVVYTDGGARGNPGPAAIGVLIRNSAGGVIVSYGEAIGHATNNEAEYRAVVSALKKVKAFFGKKAAKNMEVEVRLDSELVVKQLNGKYKVEEERLFTLFIDTWNLRVELGKIVFRHVPREENREADRLVNAALDAKQISLFH